MRLVEGILAIEGEQEQTDQYIEQNIKNHRECRFGVVPCTSPKMRALRTADG